MKKYYQLVTEKDFLEWQLNIFEKQAFFRIFKHLFFLGVLPFYLAVLMPLLVILIFSKNQGKRWIVKWLKAYCRLMFFCSNILTFKAKETKPLSKASLIMMLRKEPLQALFIFAHFKGELLIPLPPKSQKPWRNFLISRIILNSFLPWCSYPDQHFPFIEDRIQTLLARNYHVLAYFNHDKDHHFLRKQLTISKSLIPFLIDIKGQSYEIMFCHIVNWEQKIAANWKQPVFLGVEWTAFDQLFDHKMLDKNFPIVFSEKIALMFRRFDIEWQGN